MNKTELISMIAQEQGITKASAQRMLDMVLNHMTRILASGKDIKLNGFGGFRHAVRPERGYADITSGKLKRAQAKNYIVFKPSGKLNDQLNK